MALSHVSTLSHMLPYFPILIKSLLHLMTFRHLDFTHTKYDFRNLKFYGFNTSFSLHPPFRFPFEKKILPSNFEKILWSNKFFKVYACRKYFQ